MIYIILFLIFILFLYCTLNIYENFNQNNLNCTPPKELKQCLYRFKNNPSKCPSNSLYPNKPCIKCEYKRPNYDLKEDKECCRNKCYQKKLEGEPYYCQDNLTCVKKYSTSNNNKYCGFYQLETTPAKIFNTAEECYNNLNPFEK